MITGLDHIAVFVRDIDASSAAMSQVLGRQIDWQGSGGGVRQTWFQLGNTALDLIAADGDGPFGAQVKAHLDQHGEGIWAMAFRVSEAEADGNLLKRRGLGTTPFYPSKTRNADGISRVWMTASLDAAACAGLPTLLVGDHPDQPAWPQSPFRADAHACVSGLDHIVVTTLNPDRAAALYGARLGLDLRLDRTSPEWGTRFLFFRTGGATVEVVHSLKAEVSDAPDRFMGLTWLVPDIDATHARLSAQGLNLSEIRTGRRKGSRVFTLREAPAGIATLFLSQDPAEAET